MRFLKCLGVLCALFVLPARLALAESAQIVLVLAERGSATEGLESDLLGALRGQLRELQVNVLIARAAREPLDVAAHRARQIAARERALGVIWLETSQGLSVFLYDAKGHLYVREADSDGSTASQSESLAIILRSAVAAMLEGESVGMSEIQLPRPEAVPSRKETDLAPAAALTPQRDEISHVRAGASYVGTVFVRGAPWQHGLAVVLSLHPRGSPLFLGSSYTFFSRLGLESGGTAVRLARHPFELFAGARLRMRWLELDARGALSADYLERSTTRVSSGWSATPDSARWLWALSARAGATVPFSKRWFGVLTVGADYLVRPFSHSVSAQPGGSEALSSVLRVRPRAELGLLISAW
ncbi:MAG: hypothetical protein EOO73_11560 [Myxococcales bacterium]|nr:MAG: hypothetical protein EOO73_11560 [Myxococcales bacterium]